MPATLGPLSARLCRAWLAFAALASCTPQARAPIVAATTPTRTPVARTFVELDRTRVWSFRARDFPALTANGTHVVLADGGDDRYAYAAALELRWVRVASGEITRTMGILSADEYHSAFDDDKAGPDAQARLTTKVEARLATAREALAADDPARLPACTLTDVEGVGCKKQVACGAEQGAFDGGRLTIGAQVLTHAGWKPRPMDPKVVEEAVGEKLSVDLAACPSDLHYEPARRVVVVRMTYRCAGLTVGDWCSAPPAWFVVQTPG